MATEARLNLYNPEEDNMTREEEVVRNPVIPMAFSEAQRIMLQGLAIFMNTRKTKKLLDVTMAGIAKLYQQLSPEDREALDEGSGEAGFEAGVYAPELFSRDIPKQQEWAKTLATFLATQRSATGAGLPATSATSATGCRGCGCGTPGCNKGGGAKLSPGFLAKVRRHLAKL